jgi:mitogen-activated protein kinase kinase kinase 7
MAPELLSAPESATSACDVFSLGMVMWELLARREPFADLPLHALLHQLTQAPGLRPPLPGDEDWEPEGAAEEPAPGWVRLIRACWEPRPEARPSAGQVAAELEAMMRHLRGGACAGAGAARAAPRSS